MHLHDEIEAKAKASKDPHWAIAYALIYLADTFGNTMSREMWRTDHPLQGETLEGISMGLNGIAEAIEQGAAHLAKELSNAQEK